MAEVTKRRRLANPRRRMTPKQIRYFGTRRQKAGLRNARARMRSDKTVSGRKRYSRKVRRALKTGGDAKARYYVGRTRARGEQRERREHEAYIGRRNQGDYELGASAGGLITHAEEAAQRAIHSVEQAAQDAIDGVTRRLNGGRRNPRKTYRHMKAKGYSRRIRRALMGGDYAKAHYYGRTQKPDTGWRKKAKNAKTGRARNAGPRSMRSTQKRLRSHPQRGYHLWSLRGSKRASPTTAGQRRTAKRAGKRMRAEFSRRANVGEILTVIPANPGQRRKRSMAARTQNRRRNRRRNWRDPRTGLSNRRRNRGRLSNRRRNPGFMTGTTGTVVGILGGAAVTKVITGFLPSNLTSGYAGMAVTGVTAVVVGQTAGKVLKNPQFGKWMTIGGLLIVALEVVNQFIPSLQLPFGLSAGTSGMGLISSSNYYVPQVNMPGSMASFVTPAGVTAALPVAVPASGMHGIGGPQFSPGLRTMRRIGRMR